MKMKKILPPGKRYHVLFGWGSTLAILFTFVSHQVIAKYFGSVLLSFNSLDSSISRPRLSNFLSDKVIVLLILYIPVLVIWQSTKGQFHRVRRRGSDGVEIEGDLYTLVTSDSAKGYDPSKSDIFTDGVTGEFIEELECEPEDSQSQDEAYKFINHSTLIAKNLTKGLWTNIYFFYKVGEFLTTLAYHLFKALVAMVWIYISTKAGGKLAQIYPPGAETNSDDGDHSGLYSKVLKQYNRKMAMVMKLPARVISWHWGNLHQVEIPKWFRRPSYSLYCWMFNCKVHEAQEPDLSSYSCLSTFFRRPLKPGIRPISAEHPLTSPADGTVLYYNKVQDGALEQVKGVFYSLFGFLGPVKGLFSHNTMKTNPNLTSNIADADYAKMLVTKPGNALYHCIIYLAPGDYHRFHCPTDWTAKARRHWPGELFSVKPSVAKWLQGLFNFNERSVYVGDWEHGFFSMTLVGATNVGSIVVHEDKTLETSSGLPYKEGEYKDKSFTTSTKDGISLTKGEEFGEFNLGSTVVLLFEAPENFEFSVSPGQKVQVGQGIGKFGTR